MRTRHVVKRERVVELNSDYHRDSKTMFYLCHQCPYSTVYENNMISHQRQHLKEQLPVKKFWCKLCGKHFFRKQYLQSHTCKRVKRPGSLFTCSVCKKEFTYERSFRKHTYSHGNRTVKDIAKSGSSEVSVPTV